MADPDVWSVATPSYGDPLAFLARLRVRSRKRRFDWWIGLTNRQQKDARNSLLMAKRQYGFTLPFELFTALLEFHLDG